MATPFVCWQRCVITHFAKWTTTPVTDVNPAATVVGVRRLLAAAAIAVACLGALPAVASSAPGGQPVPEAADANGRTTVVDDPRLVDPRPAHVDTWSRGASEDTLFVQFTLGSPDCTGVHATVTETADTVTVALQQGTHPAAVHRMCTMIVVPATLAVPLQAPLGSRTVLSSD
jgi:hypothetical protein